ncbi:hypothetical protein COY76_04130 [bacterium CG_4_10_14_0_8_um_filter_33_57]|nr:MAG: hypothetical protein COY76_04130 [bacterium CG_4_10_14_0_8_um_filter_33_57]
MNKKGIEYFITLYSIGIGASVAAIFGKVLENYFGGNVAMLLVILIVGSVAVLNYYFLCKIFKIKGGQDISKEKHLQINFREVINFVLLPLTIITVLTLFASRYLENNFFHLGTNFWILQFSILIFAIQPTQYIFIKKFSNRS